MTPFKPVTEIEIARILAELSQLCSHLANEKSLSVPTRNRAQNVDNLIFEAVYRKNKI